MQPDAAKEEPSYNPLGDIVLEYFLRIRKHDDELGIVLKGHLFMEHLINQIISAKCKSPNKILEDTRAYTFSIKTQLLFSMGLLPEPIFRNITKMNTIRNKLAHKLDFNESLIDMRFLNRDGSETIIKPKGRGNPKRFFLRYLCVETLGQLASYAREELKLSTRYEKSIFFLKQPH
jgi:hypothetical protein